MLLIILYIKINFWCVTLFGNVCQLSYLNSSEDDVYKSQSKTTRVGLFMNVTSVSSNVGNPHETRELPKIEHNAKGSTPVLTVAFSKKHRSWLFNYCEKPQWI